MSGSLFIDRRGTRITHEGRVVTVREADGQASRIPVAMLERVVLAATTELDSGLLGFLAAEGVSVVILAGRGRERVATLLGDPHNEVRRRTAQYRAFTDADSKRQAANRLVLRKLAAQERLLRRLLRQRPDCRQPLTAGSATLSMLRGELVAHRRGVDALRGYEGAGASAYFGALGSVFPPSLEFSGRNRRPPRDPVNAVLSLGYTLLHADAVRACHAAGLDPLLGFYHEPQFGRESLAADLVEPLRPAVDRLAWDLFRTQTLRATNFARQDEACLLDKPGRAAFYPAYEQAARPVRRALRRFTLRLARHLESGGGLARQ